MPQVLEFDRCFSILAEDVVRMGRLSKSHLFRRYNSQDEKIITHCLAQVGMVKLRS